MQGREGARGDGWSISGQAYCLWGLWSVGACGGLWSGTVWGRHEG